MRLSCGSWYRQSNVANMAGGSRMATALTVNSSSALLPRPKTSPPRASTSPAANTGPGR